MRGELRRKSVLWTLIVGGHVLLLGVFSRDSGRLQPAMDSQSEQRSELVFFDLPTIAEEQEPIPRQTETPPPVARSLSPAPPATDTSITAPSEAPAPAAPVDWFAEAETVARAAGERDRQPKARAFGEIPASPYKTCKKKKSSFEWDPEPKKAGLIGILPYVRLGKRCIVGLGFWGCAVGELPPPNSHLSDDMHDPNRPTSSVPLLDECE
jgi:hypothetical protein